MEQMNDMNDEGFEYEDDVYVDFTRTEPRADDLVDSLNLGNNPFEYYNPFD